MKISISKTLLLFLFTTCFGCYKRFQWLHDKAYCVPPSIREYYDQEIPINPEAHCDDSGIDYPLPVLFKAESVEFLKDTFINFYQEELKFNVFQVKN